MQASGPPNSDFIRTARCRGLAVEAARAALTDFNVPARRLGCLFVGNFVGGIITGQELLGPIVAADLGLENVIALKVEAACASSSAAVRIAASSFSRPGHRTRCSSSASSA